MSKNGFIIREEKTQLPSELAKTNDIVKMSHYWLSESGLMISSTNSQKPKSCWWIQFITQVW